MNNHKISFDDMEWISGGTGKRYKVFIHGNQRSRLVEYSYGFVEQNWCALAHAGIVLEGGFSISFNGNVERFDKGDVIFIPSGESDKHKAILAKDEKVTLLLFECINN